MEKGIGHEFIEKTKHKHLGPSDQEIGTPQPPPEAAFGEGGAVHALPAHDAISSDVKRVIEARTSVRTYATTPLSPEELSYLLWCSQGVKAVDYGHTFRTVPSAGARHALETVVLVNSVTDMAPGLYRYLPIRHQLQEHVVSDTVAGEITYACLGQRFCARSGATFIWVAVADRMTWRYEQRGYRYLFLDVGHACQNLYLAAESIGCGACAVAAFDDDRMNEILRLDGEAMFVIYLAAVGKKRE
jgi:SagB-type dehydrogenase family enzyme